MFCFAHFLLNKLKKTKEMKQQVLLAQIDLYKSVSVLNGTLFFILFYFHSEGGRRFNRKIGERNIVLFIHFSF